MVSDLSHHLGACGEGNGAIGGQNGLGELEAEALGLLGVV
jgi:hypothetical protein